MWDVAGFITKEREERILRKLARGIWCSFCTGLLVPWNSQLTHCLWLQTQQMSFYIWEQIFRKEKTILKTGLLKLSQQHFPKFIKYSTTLSIFLNHNAVPLNGKIHLALKNIIANAMNFIYSLNFRLKSQVFFPLD